MSTTSRRIAAARRAHKPSRTKSGRAKIYIAIPPAGGWPPFTGSNWGALGVRNNRK